MQMLDEEILSPLSVQQEHRIASGLTSLSRLCFQLLNVAFGENKLELSSVVGRHHEQIHNASYDT